MTNSVSAVDVRNKALGHAIRATRSTDTPETVVHFAAIFESYLAGGENQVAVESEGDGPGEEVAAVSP